VPSIYEKYTTKRVLTMSYETGISVAKVKEMHSKGIDLKHLAQVVSEVFV